MISIERLEANFYPVQRLGSGLVRCADELPKTIFYTYFKTSSQLGFTPFLVSENLIADDFARLVLNQALRQGVNTLIKTELASNQYGFSHLLNVPHHYHSELKGRLDDDRSSTVLCVPIFKSEFSGSETPEDFITLRREVVRTRDWTREPTPKILLRFDNPKTEGGTNDGYVFALFEHVIREADNLAGSAGFVEVINYEGSVIEILASDGHGFTWIEDRNDAGATLITREALRARLWAFVTR